MIRACSSELVLPYSVPCTVSTRSVWDISAFSADEKAVIRTWANNGREAHDVLIGRQESDEVVVLIDEEANESLMASARKSSAGVALRCIISLAVGPDVTQHAEQAPFAVPSVMGRADPPV